MQLASARALGWRGPQLGTMIDESTSVVDDGLTDFGAEHFSSPVAYLVHHHCARETCEGADHLTCPATGGSAFHRHHCR
jgi:hypothetical protein